MVRQRSGWRQIAGRTDADWTLRAFGVRRGMHWTKGPNDGWTCKAPPDARFILKVAPKGDGRWVWSVFAGRAENAMATGFAGGLGAAKATAEQFARRNGAT